MKTYFNFKSTKTLSILLTAFVLLSIGLTACNKSSTDEVSGTAFIRAVNASQTSAPQDFYLEDNKLNSSPILYTQASSYSTVNAGAHNAQFRTSGTTTVNVSGALYLNPGSYSTLYYADDNTGVATQDDNNPPSSGKARVRFINLSSALNANVDFGLSTGSKLITGLAYKTASIYNDVDAATSFSLYVAGSTTATLTLPTTIQAGKIYTIVISGSTTATINYTVIAQN